MKTSAFIADEPRRATADTLLNQRHDRFQQRPLAIMAIWDALLERETKAIARELHDDLGQVLTALRMNISLFMLQHQADDALVDKANGMLVLTDRCMQAVCGLINVLRYAGFEQDIALGLERLCHDFSQRYNVPCALTVSSDCNRLDDVRTIALFRILHEALTNIARHAAARTASIAFSRATDIGLHVEIADDGCGFDSTETTEGKCLGLLLMRESASALGGRIEIVSEKNLGTRIILNIPPESLKSQEYLA